MEKNEITDKKKVNKITSAGNMKEINMSNLIMI